MFVGSAFRRRSRGPAEAGLHGTRDGSPQMRGDWCQLRQPLVRFDERLLALAVTEPQLVLAVSGVLVEAAARHACDADVLRQIPRELHIVAEAESADVGHDVVRAERLEAREVMPLEDLEQDV